VGSSLGFLTCKNRLPYNLYCVGGDVKHCTIQSNRVDSSCLESGFCVLAMIFTLSLLNPLTPTVAILVQAIRHPVPDRVKLDSTVELLAICPQ